MDKAPSNGNEHPGNGTVIPPCNGAGKPRRSASRGMSRYSALKHGVLSEAVVLPTENGSQFQQLLEQLREDRQPEGALEELLVEKIAICFWRLRRILRHDFRSNRSDTPLLLEAKSACANTDSRLEELASIRADAKNGFTNELRTRLLRCAQLRLDSSQATKDVFPFILEEAFTKARADKAKADARVEALELSYAVGNRSMDTLLRYETANERQLYRAIDQLERLQRQRVGDFVPPPAKLSVSTDG